MTSKVNYLIFFFRFQSFALDATNLKGEHKLINVISSMTEQGEKLKPTVWISKVGLSDGFEAMNHAQIKYFRSD